MTDIVELGIGVLAEHEGGVLEGKLAKKTPCVTDRQKIIFKFFLLALDLTMDIVFFSMDICAACLESPRLVWLRMPLQFCCSCPSTTATSWSR